MNSHPQNWKSGDHIVLREIWRGKVWSARPVVVAQDTPELLVVYWPEDSLWIRPAAPDGSPVQVSQRLPGAEWILTDTTWIGGDAIRFAVPREPYSVLLFRERGKENFEGWYVNLEDPLRRTPIGFDYMDMLLDVLVSHDASHWRWKDEDEFEEAQRLGLISPEKAQMLRAAGEQAVRLLQERKPPFDFQWERWRPDPTWTMPQLPPSPRAERGRG